MKIFSVTPFTVTATIIGFLNLIAMIHSVINIILKSASKKEISENFVHGIMEEIEWIDYFLRNHLDVSLFHYNNDLIMIWIWVIFVLLVYPVAEAIVNWKQGNEDNHEEAIFSIFGKNINIMHATSVFNIFQSFIIILIFTYIISYIVTTHVGYFPNVVAAIIGVLGTQLYHLVGSAWDAVYLREWHARYLKTSALSRMEQMRIGSIRRNKRIVCGTIISLLFTLMLDIYGFKYSGVLTLVFLSFLFSIYWIFDSWGQAKRIADENESKWKTMIRSSHFRVGFLILASYVLAFLRSASIIASQFESK